MTSADMSAPALHKFLILKCFEGRVIRNRFIVDRPPAAVIISDDYHRPPVM